MTVKVDGTKGLLQNYDYLVPTTGFSYTFTTANGLVLNPAATLAAGTITMPASPADGMTITISSTKEITSLTLSGSSGQTVSNAVTTLLAGGSVTYVYRLSDTTWFPYIGNSGAASATMYQIFAGSGDTASKTMNVSLTTGTWQLAITATFEKTDTGNYDFTNTATATSNSITATASVRLVRSGGSGFGRAIFGTSTAVQTLTITSTTATTLALGSVTLADGTIQSRMGSLTKIA